MKKILFLLVCQVGLFAQNTQVYEMLGDWYLEGEYLSCGSTYCPNGGDIILRTYEEKLTVAADDTVLWVNSLHHDPFPEIFLLTDYGIYVRHKVQKGMTDAPYLRRIQGKFVIDVGGRYRVYGRDASQHMRQVLLQHSWNNYDCYINEHGKLCALQGATVDRFSEKGDTLVHHYNSQTSKYVYDVTGNIHRHVDNFNCILSILNDSEILFKVNTEEHKITR
ncbi:MAG TPA: hypothetical protein VL947_08130, partial [Cytophagales bacterium]|nr:hypothetical protein [Cytophagales bacterium]